MGTFEDLLLEALPGLLPPRKMTLSEWADEYAFLSAESSAGAGKWKTLSYQKGIMDALTDPELEWVVVMKSARVGYTKIFNNLIGYHIHQDPCPIMVVQPTVDDAEGYSKEEIAPMLRDTPVLAGLVTEAKAKDGSNTILAKQFPGGGLSMVGANSPRGFRRVSRRVVVFDEPDGYPPGGAGPEGDQIKLGARRAEYYWNRKLVAGSTPTIARISKIEELFNGTDQRRYFVPCPHCEEWQYLKWGGKDKPFGIKWPKGEPEKAFYACEHNGCVIEHAEKFDMLEKGEWRATAPAVTSGPNGRLKAGFHIWAAYSYSPNATWGHLAKEFLECKDKPLKLKTFINTVLGEVWEERGQARDPDLLRNRGEDYETVYGGQVPKDVAILTAAADVQRDRVEVGIKGWTPTLESYLIDYEIFYGDTSDKNSEVWDQLDEYRLRTWRRSDGVDMQVPLLLIDSGDGKEGFLDAVYHYARHRQGQTPRVYASKGVPRHAKGGIVQQSDVRQNSIRLYTIATHAVKEMVMARLDQQIKGPGYMHFPDRMSSEYFKQLTSEQFTITENPKTGFKTGEWVKGYERNEALDVEVYNIACLNVLQNFLAPGWARDLEALLKVTRGEGELPSRHGRRTHSALRR